jgi:hypothetical protein
MRPGTGYAAAEGGSAMRVREDYWPDTQIRATATQYQSSLRRTAYNTIGRYPLFWRRNRQSRKGFHQQ